MFSCLLAQWGRKLKEKHQLVGWLVLLLYWSQHWRWYWMVTGCWGSGWSQVCSTSSYPCSLFELLASTSAGSSPLTDTCVSWQDKTPRGFPKSRSSRSCQQDILLSPLALTPLTFQIFTFVLPHLSVSFRPKKHSFPGDIWKTEAVKRGLLSRDTQRCSGRKCQRNKPNKPPHSFFQ